eukprot:789715-Lingulodinium_polyedra.AAC.1
MPWWPQRAWGASPVRASLLAVRPCLSAWRMRRARAFAARGRLACAPVARARPAEVSMPRSRACAAAPTGI